MKTETHTPLYTLPAHTNSFFATRNMSVKIISFLTLILFTLNINSIAQGILPCIPPVVLVDGAGIVCLSQIEVEYDAVLTIGTADSYSWVVPTGWSIISGQGTSHIKVNHNGISGDAVVTVTNTCGSFTATKTLIVTNCTPISVGPCIAQDGCVDFTYLSAMLTANNNVALTFKVTNNCEPNLIYAAFELPVGTVALSASVSFYLTSNFTVENPGSDPFPSVKFEANNTVGYNNGASAIFVYTMSVEDFNSMTSIDVQAEVGNTISSASFDPDGCPTNPLPVELISFEAARSQGSVLLSWATAQEKDNERFEIERSLNGRDFTRIASVKGNGNSQSRIDYRFTDNQASASISYYRLKQVDFNGQFEYSAVKAVGAGKLALEPVSVYPNPASGIVNVELAADVAPDAVVTISSVTGQLVYQGTAAQLAATNQTIDMSPFQSGVYILNVNSGIENQSLRITKL